MATATKNAPKAHTPTNKPKLQGGGEVKRMKVPADTFIEAFFDPTVPHTYEAIGNKIGVKASAVMARAKKFVELGLLTDDDLPESQRGLTPIKTEALKEKIAKLRDERAKAMKKAG
jgi:hypothetical protein